MKRTMSLAAVVVLLGIGAARAEMDYEFGKALIDRSEPSFDTEDLVLHLVSQLEKSATGKMDAKLIKATLCRKQAPKASVEKRTDLLNQAESLYREILAGDKKYAHYAVAEKEAATINMARGMALIGAAEELEKTNPKEARRMRDEAVATLGKIAEGHKKDADALRPAFDAVYKKYQDWQKAQRNPEAQIPRELLAELMKSFNAWLVADKKYIAVKVEQIECYPDGNATKKKDGEELAALCKKRAEDEAIMEFAVLVAWYNYMRGKAHAAIQAEKESSEAWKEALDQPDGELAPDQRKEIFKLKKMILHDLVRMKMRAKKYSEVELIIVDAKVSPDLRSLFEEDSGKGLMIDYAKALTLPDDASSAEYEKAIKELRGMIEREKAATRWANEFSRAIAELLDQARTKPGINPKLTAPEWYDAARGFFLMGQQEYMKYTDLKKDKPDKAQEQFEKAYVEYENAVDYYRRAITTARSDKTDLPVRVEIEPKSLFEMGLAYVKMGHLYESVIIFQSLRNAYGADGRAKWLPKLDDPRVIKPAAAKQIKDALADLDKPREGLLYKAGQNVAFAVDRNLELHRNPKDSWNPRWKVRIYEGGGAEPLEGKVSDLNYLAAKTDRDEATRLVSAAKEFAKTDPKMAESSCVDALAKFTSAGEKFMKVPASSRDYELALYQAGSALTMAQEMWMMGRVPVKSREEAEKAARDLAKKALEAYDKYDAFTAKAPVTEEEDKKRRQQLAGVILLARSALYGSIDDWEQVIKTADQYVAWEQLAGQQGYGPQRSSQDVVLLKQFRALVEIGAKKLAPECDPYLAKARKASQDWRALKQGDNTTYAFMLRTLSSRYNIAAFQVEKFLKEKKPGITDEMLDEYEKKVALLERERLRMIEQDPDWNPSLEDYARLVYLFAKASLDAESADTAQKLLQKFDPENKNCRMPDEEQYWQGLLDKMLRIIKYDDLNKMERCKKDHTLLVDLMYDTAVGLNQADPAKRPANDKVNADLGKALKQIDTIMANYKQCQTSQAEFGPEPEKGQERKGYLPMIAEEIDFRQKIQAARDLLFNKSLAVATKAEQAGEADEAKRYREIAGGQLEILRELLPDSPALTLLQARLHLSVGKYSEALETLNEVKAQLDESSPVYFEANKMTSEVFFAQKKWKEAADYPQFYALTITFDSKMVKDKWPDMKSFLAECYKNGAPCPDALKKLLEKKAGTEDTETKPEEKKPDEAAKPEEKKADEAAKPEDKKADEKKPEAPAKEDEKKADEKKPEAAKAEPK
jgi:hypothetical protein